MDNAGVVAHCFEVIAKVTRGLDSTDFRVVANCGPQAGQSVGYLHVNGLAGRGLGWPPG